MNRHYPFFVAGLVSTLTGMGCVAKPEFTGRVTVLTYDAHDADGLAPEIEALIREANADVVCVQQADRGWCRTFKHQFSRQYPAALFADDGFFGVRERPAFFSKYDLREIRYLPRTDGGTTINGRTNIWLVEAQTPAGPLQIANICLSELRTGVTGKGAGLIGISKYHGPEMDAILAAMPSDSPCLIVGNFNGDHTDPAVRRAQRRGFIDALSTFDSQSPTWRDRKFFVPVSAQRDHILCSRHFQAVAARVLSTRASDHSPVWAELKMADKATTMPEQEPVGQSSASLEPLVPAGTDRD